MHAIRKIIRKISKEMETDFRQQYVWTCVKIVNQTEKYLLYKNQNNTQKILTNMSTTCKYTIYINRKEMNTYSHKHSNQTKAV